MKINRPIEELIDIMEDMMKDVDKLLENTRSFVDAVQKAKPASAKGRYVQTVFLCSTMGPGVQVDLVSLDVK